MSMYPPPKASPLPASAHSPPVSNPWHAHLPDRHGEAGGIGPPEVSAPIEPPDQQAEAGAPAADLVSRDASPSERPDEAGAASGAEAEASVEAGLKTQVAQLQGQLLALQWSHYELQKSFHEFVKCHNIDAEARRGRSEPAKEAVSTDAAGS